MTDYDILINGVSASSMWGVRMGENFLNTLSEPLTPKDYIENESRLEHGKRIITENAPLYDRDVFMASRELTLEFHIEGENEEDFKQKKSDFLTAMYRGYVEINVPKLGSEIYKLIYKGASGEYAMSPARNFCAMSLKFEEPNPMDRDNPKHELSQNVN